MVWFVRIAGLLLLALVAAGYCEAQNIAKYFASEPWLGPYQSEILWLGLMGAVTLSSRFLVYGLRVRWRLGLVFAATVVATLIAENWTWTSAEMSQWNDLAAGYMVWFYVFPAAAFSLAFAAIPLGDGKPRKKLSQAAAGEETPR